MRGETLGGSICRFFTAPASPVPLAVFRIGVGSVLLLQALFLSPRLFELFGTNGILQSTLSAGFESTWFTRCYALLMQTLAGAGGDPDRMLIVTAIAYLASLVFLILGIRTRLAAGLACMLHLVLMTAGHATNYGADSFGQMALFYLVFIPGGAALSYDGFRRPEISRPSAEARLSLRIIQIHLCIVYLTTGLEKAAGPQWWNGEAIWRSLMLPTYRQFDFSWIAGVPSFATWAGITTLVVEIGYFLFMWNRRTRKPWLALIVGLHAGIALFLGLWTFAALMIVFSVAAFGVRSEPAGSMLQIRALDNQLNYIA